MQAQVVEVSAQFLQLAVVVLTHRQVVSAALEAVVAVVMLLGSELSHINKYYKKN
jgi:hypothetical protein